jgi:hypothetical protein
MRLADSDRGTQVGVLVDELVLLVGVVRNDATPVPYSTTPRDVDAKLFPHFTRSARDGQMVTERPATEMGKGRRPKLRIEPLRTRAWIAAYRADGASFATASSRSSP